MAKQNYLKLAIVIVLTMAVSSTVYAANVVTTEIGGSSFNPSMKVSCYYDSDGAAGSYNGSNYGIACGHANGDKVIAAKSGGSALYFKATGAGQGAAGVTVASSTLDVSTWTSM